MPLIPTSASDDQRDPGLCRGDEVFTARTWVESLFGAPFQPFSGQTPRQSGSLPLGITTRHRNERRSARRARQ